MIDLWPEVSLASSEERRELVLKGTDKDLLKRVAKAEGKLPSALYDLQLLNFLEINTLGIHELDDRISNLCNLTQLICCQNSIDQLPDSITRISSLKILDMSGNGLLKLPSAFGQLTNLHTLNVANNKLEDLPQTMSNLRSLAVLDISSNRFSNFPEVLCENTVCERLAELHASHNVIEDVTDEIEKLVLLKVLDLSHNRVKELTQAIGGCLKLKQVNFMNNPLNDRRLKKLIDQNNSQKSIMDYIRSKGKKRLNLSGGSEAESGLKTQARVGRKKLKDQKAQEATLADSELLVRYLIQVLKVADHESYQGDLPFRVIVCDEVKDIRPFIVCCIVKGLDLSEGDKFKNFISLQTRLHDEVCGKRTIATIATHDMKHLKGADVVYDAQESTDFMIRPLGRRAEVTALELYQRLCKEADDARREKKRNQVSGIYKYLTLLKNQTKFAFLRRTSDNCVISLPPLTNCDATKISSDSSDIFIEVTGSKSLNSCKSVLDEMLKRMTEQGYVSKAKTAKNDEKDFYDDSSDEEGDEGQSQSPLVVQQVRVEDAQGRVRVVYPSRPDLVYNSKEIKVQRPK